MGNSTTSQSTPSEVSGVSPAGITLMIVLLEGDIATSYTEADNSCVVATDTSELGVQAVVSANDNSEEYSLQ